MSDPRPTSDGRRGSDVKIPRRQLHGGQLKAVLTGERAPIVSNGTDEAVASWRAILEEVRRYGASKILIIDRMSGPASSPRAVAVGKAIKAGTLTGLRCALVVEDDIVRKNVVLGVRMAIERCSRQSRPP